MTTLQASFCKNSDGNLKQEASVVSASDQSDDRIRK